MPDRPNIVLVHSHDLGRRLGCYGVDVATPNVDAIADDGLRFDQFTCTAPQCSPSRGSLHTGRYPHNNGLMGLTHRGWSLDDVPTLAATLSDAGYDTHTFGVQHIAEDDADAGYDYSHRGGTALDAAECFEAELPEMAADGPFFASVGFVEPHLPFRVDHVEDAAYDRYHPENVDAPPYLPDEYGVKRDVAEMHALISETVDPAVGHVRDALDDAGLAEETLFVFTTDHGPPLPRAKGMCYTAGVGVAFIAHWPGVVESGVDDHLLSNVDVMPTFLDVAGVDKPPEMDGRTFAPLLTGEGTYDPREQVFVEMTWHDRYNPIRGIRTEEYTYLRNFSMLPRVFIPRDMIDQRAARPVRGEWYDRDRPAEEFYDRREDPHELENLAAEAMVSRSAPADWDVPDPPTDLGPDRYAALHEFRERLREWMRATDDPLLDGPVGIPGR
ncbi:MAG: sulfatase [Halobacteriaceae archaeon]